MDTRDRVVSEPYGLKSSAYALIEQSAQNTGVNVGGPMIDPSIETMPDGRYRSFSMVGGYSIFYKREDGANVCASCLNTETEFVTERVKEWNIIGADIHWEGSMECACCESPIEASYPQED